MSELLFMQALREVGADESKWGCVSSTSYIWTKRIVDMEAYAFIDGRVGLENDDGGYVEIRKADNNLVEAVRFAENLRRLLSGDPPLPTPMAGHALSERQPPRPGHYLIKERPEYPWAYAWVSEHIDGTMLACVPAHGEVKYTHWAGPIPEPEEVSESTPTRLT